MLQQAKQQKQANFGRIQIEVNENDLSTTTVQSSFDSDGEDGKGGPPAAKLNP